MNRNLNVHLLPELANPHELAGHTSVVIDVLRASTTITTALDAGAARIIPCLTVEEARNLAGQRPGSLLGGERQGERLPGFDFGNSPAEYSAEKCADQTIVFTTTNGTKALTRCMGAGRVVIGAIINRHAVCQSIEQDDRIDLICAGTNDAISLDDVLAAGAIVEGLTTAWDNWCLNDSADLARSLWREVNQPDAAGAPDAAGDTPSRIVAALSRSQGGRNLLKIGMDADLPLAARLDHFARVPELDRSNWEIR